MKKWLIGILVALGIAVLFAAGLYYLCIPPYPSFTKEVSSYQALCSPFTDSNSIFLPQEDEPHTVSYTLLMDGRFRTAKPIAYSIYRQEVYSSVTLNYHVDCVQEASALKGEKRCFEKTEYITTYTPSTAEDKFHYVTVAFNLAGRQYTLSAWYEDAALSDADRVNMNNHTESRLMDDVRDIILQYNEKYGIEPEPEPAPEKPIIYLYPTVPTQALVTLGSPERILCSYPKYTAGWRVNAQPDGTLTDCETGRELYSLYYENVSPAGYTVGPEGFVVRGADSIAFLEEKLALLGLNAREAEEFIVYWLPRLAANEWNYIHFATPTEIAANMELTIEPQPDSIIRVLMLYCPLDAPIEVSAQTLTTPAREGFTAVEWGGAELKPE